MLFDAGYNISRKYIISIQSFIGVGLNFGGDLRQ